MSEILDENKNGLVKKASLLNLSAQTLAESLRMGGFKSVYRGQGIEFHGVREYNPGDNVRSIDWNVTARMGRPFIKLYEEDRELQVLFILDRSLSMFSSSGKKTRVQTASEVAALLVLACLQNQSSVGAVFFDGKINFTTKPKAGRDHAMSILSRLDEIQQKIEKGSALSGALTAAEKMLKRHSMIFVISDFRTDGWQDSLARLAVVNDVIAIKVTDPIDSELPGIGTAVFADLESGFQQKIPASSKAFKTAWLEANRRRNDVWKEFCVRHGVNPLFLSTSEDPFLALNRFFLARRSV